MRQDPWLLPGAKRGQEIDAFLEPPDRIQSHQPLGLTRYHSSDLAIMMKSPGKKVAELNKGAHSVWVPPPPPLQGRWGGTDIETGK